MLFSLQQGQIGRRRIAAAAAGDPNRANRLLVLHCNGSNGGTTFTDSSTYARTMTVTGTLITSTSSPKFGSACALVQASGDFVRSSAITALGFGAITMAAWVKATHGDEYGSFFSTGPFNGGNGIQIFIGATGVVFRSDGTSDLSATGLSLNDGNWHYVKCYIAAGIAAVPRAKVIMVDGSTVASGTTLSNLESDNLDIGSIADSGGSFRFSGSFDEVVISDYADTSTTVPTTELADS
jgi:hypothetical protein